MTNEEKAKAYEMALEVARKELGVDRKEWEVVEHVLRNIFPELRESEDERVIKALETFINQPEIADKITFEARIEWLAWLEKQKEQKPAIEICPHSIKSKSYLETGYPIEQKSAEWSDYKDKVNIPYCSSEPEWSEEDEETIRLVVKIFEKNFDADSMFGTASHKPIRRDSVIERLKRLRPSWKPSEEQIKELDKARHFIPYNCDILSSIYDQLKKL